MDGVALRLLSSDLYEPACFTHLPEELKLKILELLPAVDIARTSCVCREMRFLCADNDLWKRKCSEEIGHRDLWKLRTAWPDLYYRCYSLTCLCNNWKKKFVFCRNRQPLCWRDIQLFSRCPKKIFLPNDIDLLNPPDDIEKTEHKLKRLVRSPNSIFMDVKCQGCFNIATVFSHSEMVVVCGNCQTGGRARVLTEGCSFKRK